MDRQTVEIQPKPILNVLTTTGETAIVANNIMPNLHASIKDLRKSQKRTERNHRMKTHIKALTRQLTDLAKAGKKAEATEISKKLQQAFAKATKNFVVHKNNAQRHTSKAVKLVANIK